MYRSSASSTHDPTQSQSQSAAHHSHLLRLIEECVRQTEDCVSHTEECIRSLHPGVEDLPRLSKVVENKRCFLFVPEPTVDAHKHRLGLSIDPQIDELILRSERSLASLERRDAALRRKLTTLQSEAVRAPAPAPAAARKGPTPAEERRLKMVEGRRDKLRRELEELEAEG